MVYYFAYGANMEFARMKRDGITIINKFSGRLNGYRLVFNTIRKDVKGGGYGNIVPDSSSHVEGIVYETDLKSIKILDKQEEYPILYIKKKVMIGTKKGEIECIAYVAAPSMTKGGLKPTKDYMSMLKKGKPYLSRSYYKKLRNIETL